MIAMLYHRTGADLDINEEESFVLTTEDRDNPFFSEWATDHAEAYNLPDNYVIGKTRYDEPAIYQAGGDRYYHCAILPTKAGNPQLVSALGFVTLKH